MGYIVMEDYRGALRSYRWSPEELWKPTGTSEGASGRAGSYRAAPGAAAARRAPCRSGCRARRCLRCQRGPRPGGAPARSPQLVARTRGDPGPASGHLPAASPPWPPEKVEMASASGLGTQGPPAPRPGRGRGGHGRSPVALCHPPA